MPTIYELIERVDALVPEEGLGFSISSIEEAKLALKKVRLLQKELRIVKREVNTVMKSIRADYSAKLPDAGSGGGFALRLLGGKGAARQHEALAKRDLRNRRDRELEPYEKLKDYIDSAILSGDRAKLEIEEYILTVQAQEE